MVLHGCALHGHLHLLLVCDDRFTGHSASSEQHIDTVSAYAKIVTNYLCLLLLPAVLTPNIFGHLCKTLASSFYSNIATDNSQCRRRLIPKSSLQYTFTNLTSFFRIPTLQHPTTVYRQFTISQVVISTTTPKLPHTSLMKPWICINAHLHRNSKVHELMKCWKKTRHSMDHTLNLSPSKPITFKRARTKIRESPAVLHICWHAQASWRAWEPPTVP